MDYAKIASQVIENVGGKENIKSVAHCATRLRLQLKNNDLRNEEVISDIEGVKGVFLTQSQFQIIFGSGLVNLVCNEVQKQLGTIVETAEEDEKEEKGNLLQQFVKMLSDIFVPIIPAIVAGGLLMGLNNILTSGMFDGKSIIDLYPQWKGLATAINTFANAPFVFLPVLIGFSATKKFGGNPFLGAAMGMIMVHPDLLNAYSIGVVEPPIWDIFGFQIEAIGYQGTVLPVLAVSFILAFIEKRLHKVTPTWLDNLTTPLLSIMVTSFLTFICVGPVLREAGNLLAAGITWVYNTLGFVGGGLFGLAYAPICLTGMHHSFIAIETQLIAEVAKTGGSFIFTTASMNNVAQGAAGIPGIISMKPDDYMNFIIGLALSMAVSATLTIVFWKKFNIEGETAATANTKEVVLPQNNDTKAIVEEKEEVVLYAPLKGEVLPVEKAADPAFASKAMGDGVAINPEDNVVYAPADGTVSLVFPTKHAMGITLTTGAELLIHVGLDTVQMEGEGFETYVKAGDQVKKGDKLISFDRGLIAQKGFKDQTMLLVAETNGQDVEVMPAKEADLTTEIIKLK